jgi:hypothetical protein
MVVVLGLVSRRRAVVQPSGTLSQLMLLPVVVVARERPWSEGAVASACSDNGMSDLGRSLGMVAPARCGDAGAVVRLGAGLPAVAQFVWA